MENKPSPAPLHRVVGLRPYYDEAGITIYHADCAQVLPFLDPVDLLLTDPPYGIKRAGIGAWDGRGHHGGSRKAYEDFGWDDNRPDVDLIRLAVAKASLAIIWGGNYFIDGLKPSSKWLVWDKGQRISQADGELAYTNIPGAVRIRTVNRCAIKADGACHPTQKPVEIMAWCIREAGEVRTILDPFMGSGTTLVAAKNLGKRAIGIERELKYCEIAVRRLAQQTLFQVEQSNTIDQLRPTADPLDMRRQLPGCESGGAT